MNPWKKIRTGPFKDPFTKKERIRKFMNKLKLYDEKLWIEVVNMNDRQREIFFDSSERMGLIQKIDLAMKSFEEKNGCL